MELYRDPVVEEVRERGRTFTGRYADDPRQVMQALREYASSHPEKMVNQIRVVRSEEAVNGS